MAKLRRTLLVGLGGTGVKSILNAKKMFYDNYGEIPPMVGFLGIDTDKPGLMNASVEAADGTRISLDNSEQLDICVSEPRAIYQNNIESKLFDWLPSGNAANLDSLSIGAGQTRSNGRFAITVNERNVESFIKRKIGEINNARIVDNTKYQLLGADTEVHMVFSLGGGTGSGTFLNTAYLVKRILPTVKLSGYAVLSDVFREMMPGAMTARVKANGMGSLMDLDFLAHLDAASEPVEVKWFHQTDKVSERPFTALYLIDNRNANNDTFNDVKSLCEMISLAIVTSVGELGVALDSVADNVNKLINDNAMDIRNKRAWIASFGCSELIFDGSRLAEIYSSKAISQVVNIMLNGGCDDPSQIANNWFDENKIRENNGKDDVIDYFIESPNPPIMFADIDNPENPEPECMQFVEVRAMVSNTELNQKMEALKDRIDKSLTRLLKEQANRECGIFLCREILNSILKEVNLCDGEMDDEKKQLEDELPRRESALKSACKELSECMSTWLKRGRKEFEENVAECTMALARQKREIKRREMARGFYNWLQVRIGQSLNRVDIITRNLEDARNKSNEKVQRLQRLNDGASFFQFDLTAESSAKIDCPLSDIVINNFINAVKPEGGVTAFSEMNSNEVLTIIKNYTDTLPKVEGYARMGVNEILGSMSEQDLSALISKAIQKSQPLLPFSYGGYEVDLKNRPVETYYIGVPSMKTCPLCQSNIFERSTLNGESVQFTEVGLNNRIIIYRQLGVIPTYTLKALDSYTIDYEKWEETKKGGSHWDLKVYDRMLRERFALEPKDDVSEAKKLKLWVEAVVFDLIRFNNGQYQISSRAMGGRAMAGFWVNLGKRRLDAYNLFCDNMDILVPEISMKLQQMDVPGPENKLRALAARARKSANDGTYLQEVSKCPISPENIESYPQDYDMLDKEMTYILDSEDF